MTVMPTPSQTIGPFFRFGMQWLAGRDEPSASAPGLVSLSGVVFDGDDLPVPDAMVEVYSADPSGEYPAGHGNFSRCLTDDQGCYQLTLVKPGRVDDRQAPHLEVSVFARGLLQRLLTRIYFPDEAEANSTDPVLAAVGDADRAATLVARQESDGLQFDIHLQGRRETVFFAW